MTSTEIEEPQYLDEMDEKLYISPYVELVDDKGDMKEKTMLDGYLKLELNSLIATGDRADTNAWKSAKEKLGLKLITRDMELDYYKKKSTIMGFLNVALGAGIIGLYYLKK